MAVLASVDVSSTIVGFSRALRAAGIGVGSGQVEAFARSFEWLDPCSHVAIRHAARATLLCRHEDTALFERVFDAFWLGAEQRRRTPAKMPLAPRHRAEERPTLAVLLAERARASDPERSVRDRSLARSDDEVLGRKDFSLMTALELDAIQRLFERRRWQFATRVTRRKVSRSSGKELDLRRLCSRAARGGGVALKLPRRAAKIKQRPLVVLADISGSMELYSRVLLQFMHVLRRRLADVETFVFATRLTRITAELAVENVDHALDQVSGSVADFASGTRIGESLHAFNTAWAGRLLTRGAVVIIMSDGWERGSAEQLKKEMRVLREKCYRLIWLNPRLGHTDYLPRVEGMAAALGHVDDFLPCHDMQSLEALARHLEGLPRQRGAQPGLWSRGLGAGSAS